MAYTSARDSGYGPIMFEELAELEQEFADVEVEICKPLRTDRKVCPHQPSANAPCLPVNTLS